MVDTRIEALKIAILLNPEIKDLDTLIEKAQEIINWFCS